MGQNTFWPLLHWPDFLVIPSLGKKLNVFWLQKSSITNLIEAPEEKVFAKVPELSASFCSRIGCGQGASVTCHNLPPYLAALLKFWIPISSKQPPRGARYSRDTGLMCLPFKGHRWVLSFQTIPFSVHWLSKIAAHPHKVDSPVRPERHRNCTNPRSDDPPSDPFPLILSLISALWSGESRSKSWLILLFTLTASKTIGKFNIFKISRSILNLLVEPGGTHCKGNKALYDII